MDDGVEITGLVEVHELLMDLPDAIARTGMRDALAAGSAVLRTELRRNTPQRVRREDLNYEFPPLEQSITTEIEVERTRGVASTGFGNNPIGLWLEYGHRVVTHARKDTGKIAEGIGFMSRTTADAAEPVVEAFGESIQQTLRKLYGY